MINKIIQKQLNKLTVAKLPEYDEIKHQYVFKKQVDNFFQQDGCYLIQLSKDLLDNRENKEVVYNYNHGSCPTSVCMRVVVCVLMNKLINVTGVNYDLETRQQIVGVWSGWLPKDKLTILEEYK